MTTPTTGNNKPQQSNNSTQPASQAPIEKCTRIITKPLQNQEHTIAKPSSKDNQTHEQKPPPSKQDANPHSNHAARINSESSPNTSNADGIQMQPV
mmetsp:Transcript_18423/g.28071  ORF Transcript_18423/g.28071 Transcript_18423/m.28071 type:complete len:96 (-) Transcript_18423:119-406(-)